MSSWTQPLRKFTAKKYDIHNLLDIIPLYITKAPANVALEILLMIAAVSVFLFAQ